MTQTILSVTTPARPERRAALRGSGFVPPGKSLDAGSVAQALLPVRYCYAECEEPLHTVASHAAKILIANLELESQLTHRKLSPLRIPNSKYSRVLPSLRRTGLPTLSASLHCPEPRGQQVAPHKPFLVITSLLIHGSLIHGSAIKSRRKPFENSNLQISNRRQTGPRCGAKVQKSRQDASATRSKTWRAG
jgi:hypothetical protein